MRIFSTFRRGGDGVAAVSGSLLVVTYLRVRNKADTTSHEHPIGSFTTRASTPIVSSKDDPFGFGCRFQEVFVQESIGRNP